MPGLTLSDKNFSNKVFESPKPFLVDFWAEWCIPCQMIAPIIKEITDKFGEKIKIGRLNIDDNPLIANTFSVNAVPTLILFKDGKIVKRFVGIQPKSMIMDAINSIIEN